MKKLFAALLAFGSLMLAPAVADTVKNPEWMELYWNVFCHYVEDGNHKDETDLGRYAYIDMFDFDGDGTPEMILNARLFTIRDGKVLVFQGYHMFSLYRNKDTGEEKYMRYDMQGTSGDYVDVYTEYHIDWDRLIITKGEDVARYYERDLMYEITGVMEFEGEEISSIAETQLFSGLAKPGLRCPCARCAGFRGDRVNAAAR